MSNDDLSNMLDTFEPPPVDDEDPLEQTRDLFNVDIWRQQPQEDAVAKKPWWRRGPSPKQLAEMARQRDLKLLATPFKASTKRIVVANTSGKGGKTTLAVLMGAALGHWTGRSVLIVENGPTGTLRNRLESVPRPIHDMDELAKHLVELEGRPDASTIIQAVYAIWQNQGQFSVILGRQEMTEDNGTGQLVTKQPTLTRGEVARIVGLLGHIYPWLIIDSGNNACDEAWLGSVDVADLLLLPTTWGGTEMEGVITILKTLNETHQEHLAWSSIVVVTQPPGMAVDPKNKANAMAFFQRQGVTVVEIPPDPAMAERDKPILWDQLSPVTHEAMLKLCATVVERLHTFDMPARGRR